MKVNHQDDVPTEGHLFTVGELARLVGVSVRTLQYYDQNDLLPVTFSKKGRRLYGREAMFKLQQLLFLKEFGFSLKEINYILEQGKAGDFRHIFMEQRMILLKKIEHMQQIVSTLNAVIAEATDDEAISLDKLMLILKLMKDGNPYSFVVHYFKDEQLQQLMSRFVCSPQTGDAFSKRANALFLQLQQLYETHADPAGTAGQAFAKAWWAMVTEFTGGNKHLLQTLMAMGEDMDNWPAEAEVVRESIRDFLSAALDIYFKNNTIHTEWEDDRDG